MLIKPLKIIGAEPIAKKETTTQNKEVVNNAEPEKKISYKGQMGGKRPNAGRPKGGENERTKKKKAAEIYIQTQTVESIKSIFESQMNLALGCQLLFKIKKSVDKNGKETKQKPVLVTGRTEIERYLAGEFEGNANVDYYYITTEKPDMKAIDSLMNRVFGKPKESLDVNATLTAEDIMIKLLMERRGIKTEEDEDDSES